MNNAWRLALLVGIPLIIIIVGIGVFVNTGELSLPSSSVIGGRQAQREPLKLPVLPTDLYLSGDMLVVASGASSVALQEIRTEFISQLITQGFSGFITVPYPVSGHNALTATGIGNTYTVDQTIIATDPLDLFLSGVDFDEITELKIPKAKRSARSNIFLFKNTQDLEQLGYTVVSHRTRMSKDESYRRTNISQAFKLLGNVRVLLPGQQLEFLRHAQYDGNAQENYLEGYAIIENEEEKVYGGGICGASTALYQGIVTNKALEPTKLRSHSKWFTNLYTATINGQIVKNPGIDSAIYDGVIDLHLKNTSDHPIIIVLNYDGTLGGPEEVFSLGFAEDLGSIEYVGGYRTSMEIPDNSPLPTEDAPEVVEADSFDSSRIRDGGSDEITDNPDDTIEPIASPPSQPSSETQPPTQRMKTIYGGCHTRLINGVEKRSCYREIK